MFLYRERMKLTGEMLENYILLIITYSCLHRILYVDKTGKYSYPAVPVDVTL